MDVNRLENAKKYIQKQDYVITVIGAMKSGKSTFINAILGADLMPNENAACTLTTTEINFGSKSNKINKIYKNGKSETIEGKDLAGAFLSEVRETRKTKIKKHFTYQMQHPIYSLPYENDNSKSSLIIMDTPGINEMESAGLEKDIILNSFNESILRTDLLIYVIDYQYFKAEENEIILNNISEIRPELLKKTIFVINKIDKLNHKDKSIENVTAEVGSALEYWGIKNPTLYPVSAKKALLGRVLKVDSQNSFYRNQIDPFLKITEVDIGGVLCAVKTHSEEAYQEVIQDSGIERFEKEVLIYSFNHLEELYDTKQKELIKECVYEVVDQINLKRIEIKERNVMLQKAIDQLLMQSGALKSLWQENQRALDDASLFLHNQVALKKIHTSTLATPEIPELQVQSDYIQYTSIYSAENAAKKILERYLKSIYTQMASGILDIYSNELNSANSRQFFQHLTEKLRKKVQSVNQALEKYNKQYKDKLRILNAEFFIQASHVSGKHSSALNFDEQKLKKYMRKFQLNTHREEVTEYFLLIFPTTSYKHTYSQDFTKLKNEFKDIFTRDVNLYNEQLFQKMSQIKYEEYPSLLQTEFLNRVKVSNEEILEKSKELQTKVRKLKNIQNTLNENLIELTLLNRILKERTDFLNLNQSVCVAPQNITDYLLKSDSGTTLILSKGLYTIKNDLELLKPIFIKGAGADTIIECNGSITMPEHHCFMMEDVTFIQKNRKKFVLKNQLYLSISNCFFDQGCISIEGDTVGSINKCIFSNSEEAIVVDTFDLLTIESNQFEHNEIGISIRNSAQTVIINNLFRLQTYGIVCKDSSRSQIAENEYVQNELAAIRIINTANPVIKNNCFTENREAGLLFEDKSSGVIRKNKFQRDNNSILLLQDSSPLIKENCIEDSLNNGIRVEHNAVANIFKNNCSGSNSSGIVMINNSKIFRLSENNIYNNGEHGISVDQQVNGQIQDNKCYQNNNSGIYVNSNNQINIINNCLKENGEQGIFLSGSGTYWLDNNSCLNNGNGIKIDGNSSVGLNQNNIKNNEIYGINLIQVKKGRIIRNVLEQNGCLTIYFKRGFNLDLTDNQFSEKRFAAFYFSYWMMKFRRYKSHRIHKKGIQK